HIQGKRRRHRRIDGISATAKDGSARLGSERMRGRHRAARRHGSKGEQEQERDHAPGTVAGGSFCCTSQAFAWSGVSNAASLRRLKVTITRYITFCSPDIPTTAPASTQGVLWAASSFSLSITRSSKVDSVTSTSVKSVRSFGCAATNWRA